MSKTLIDDPPPHDLLMISSCAKPSVFNIDGLPGRPVDLRDEI